MFGAFFPRGGTTFETNLRAYPVSFLDKLDAENGDKIFLPPSALDRLASLHIEYPMLFRLENRKTGRATHCGVLEFIADEGMMYLPYWMMQNLVVEEGDIVAIRSATLPKGSYVKLQPHTQDFLDITNPKAVLETTLRGFSCLTTGDTICLPYNARKYFIDVVEARPEGAISVIETDCEVDFAPPLDYVEPSRQPPPPEPAADEPAGPSEAAEEPEAPRFQAFAGAGRRLDGKPSAAPAATAAAGPSSSGRPAVGGGGGAPGGGGPTGGGGGKKPVAGKVVSTGNRLLDRQAALRAAEARQGQGGAAPAPPAPKQEEGDTPEQKPGFQAFSGKGRSLKG